MSNIATNFSNSIVSFNKRLTGTYSKLFNMLNTHVFNVDSASHTFVIVTHIFLICRRTVHNSLP